MQQQSPLPPPLPPQLPSEAAPPPKKPSEIRQILVGGLAFIGICIGLLVLALGYGAITHRLRPAASASAAGGPAVPARVLAGVSADGIARAFGARRSGPTETANGLATTASDPLVAVAQVSADASGVSGVLVKAGLGLVGVDMDAQMQLVGDVVAAATGGWIGAHAWSSSRFFDLHDAFYAIDGFAVAATRERAANGTLVLAISIVPEPVPADASGASAADLETFRWVQRAAPMVAWAGEACFRAERCLYHRPFEINGARFWYPPDDFDICTDDWEPMCRRAYDDLATRPAPEPIARAWGLWHAQFRSKLGQLGQVRALRARYPSIRLRSQDDGFEDYTTWLSRRDSRAAEAWASAVMDAITQTIDGYNDLRAWFDERFCCTNGACFPHKVGEMAERSNPVMRVPRPAADPLCQGLRR